MNAFTIIAGLIALAAVVGHFTMGSKQFLKPMLAAEFDAIPKAVMHSVFHYMSAYLIIAAATLLAVGFGAWNADQTAPLLDFIATSFAGFAIAQLAVAIGSDIPRAPVKLFQWMFFALVAVFALLGARA